MSRLCPPYSLYQVQHIGLGAIPRLVSLKEYVPPTSRELQDWMEHEVCMACVWCVHVVMEVGGGCVGGYIWVCTPAFSLPTFILLSSSRMHQKQWQGNRSPLRTSSGSPPPEDSHSPTSDTVL